MPSLSVLLGTIRGESNGDDRLCMEVSRPDLRYLHLRSTNRSGAAHCIMTAIELGYLGWGRHRLLPVAAFNSVGV